MNENDAYIFDVEEPRRWVFDGKPVWISGWFLSKTGAVFSDIRAVIDGVPHMGILGLPHKHVEMRYRGYHGLPHAGFALQVRPPKRAKQLKLELLDKGNRWVEIWRTGIKVTRGPRNPLRLNAALIPATVERLLQAQRADPGGDLSVLAENLAVESAAVPLEVLPVPPFYGSLENPGHTGPTQFGKLRVEGWIIHLEQRITRLIASTHPLVENVVDDEHHERADAAEMFPDHPYAARSQFFGLADIDENVPNPVCLKLFAELEDGTRHLAFVRRFMQRSCRQEEQSLPAFGPGPYWRALRALVTGCGRRGVRLPPVGETIAALRRSYRRFRRAAPSSLAHLDRLKAGPYDAWLETNRLSPRLKESMTAAAARIAGHGPKFCVLIDARGCAADHVFDLATSLKTQLYPTWEAWIVADTKRDGRIDLRRLDDPRFHTEAATGEKDFVRALNAAAHQSTGAHLALIPGHSRLSPDALLQVAEAIEATPSIELVYTDEDRMDAAGNRSDPEFKPVWSPALALSGLFPGQLCVVRRERFVELGSFRDDFQAIPWFDYLLRLGDRLEANQTAHVPRVCYHARAEVTLEVDPSDISVEVARQALADATRRRGLEAEPFLPEAAHHRKRRFHQLKWNPKILSRLPVTIVIPTRDRLHLLQECVELLDETVDWRYVKLVIVDDHSRDPDAVRYLAAIQSRNDLVCAVVRPPDPLAPFNYSKLVNLGTSRADTPLVLHLNNDVNALERGWLEEMTGWFSRPDVGVVGARLYYPKKTLNHTGIVIGPHGGLADTPFAGVREDDIEDARWFAAAREVSAVTGACLMTRTDLYRELGGFDEGDFGVAFNDVDFCLRVGAAGRRVIYTPQAKLMHWGSATRGVTFNEDEHIAFVRRNAGFQDPCFSPHVELADNRVAIRRDSHAHLGRAGKPGILLITHNLNLEGAPLFLLEYATYLVREQGFRIQVVSSQEGPLRAPFEDLGCQIALVDRHRLYSSRTEEEFSARVAEVRTSLDLSGVDVVVCNTLVSFWGVHLARLAGKASLFQIHESTSIFRFFERMLDLPMHRLVEQAFQHATRALFLCKATRAYYEDYNVNGNYRLISSWIRIDDVEAFKRKHSREELRRKHGLHEDEVVIANIGTVCERKGQHIFIRAIDHFNHHNQGRGPFRFLMVGARPGIFLDLLKADIERLNLRNVTLVPETREAFDFFRLADLFVCTSYEESFPRVVMEAMAFRTPIVTTDVHGVPEMVRQRAEAYLVKPGDVEGLSRMMTTCLVKERSGKSLTPTAYSKALRCYDHQKVLPRHADMIREAWLAHQ